MHYLDLLLIDWVFWPLDAVLFLFIYICLDTESYRSRWSGWSVFWTLALAALVWDKWREFPTFPHLLEGLAAYIALGFGVSLYKYLAVLHDFKSEAPAIIALKRSAKSQEYIAHEIVLDLKFPIDSVLRDDKFLPRYYVNWKAFPIALWWAYWPCFILSVILDPIQRIARELVNRMKTFYAYLAQKFSVSSS